MKRRLKILGLAAGVAAILALAIVGTVAASSNPGTGLQNQGDECFCGQCPAGDCVNLACEPNDYSYGHNYGNDYDHDYSSPGPHGP
jgi:hypothetical protein